MMFGFIRRRGHGDLNILMAIASALLNTEEIEELLRSVGAEAPIARQVARSICHLHLNRSAAQDGAPRAAQLNAKKFCS
jgi:nickel-dependent lactate racemase